MTGSKVKGYQYWFSFVKVPCEGGRTAWELTVLRDDVPILREQHTRLISFLIRDVTPTAQEKFIKQTIEFMVRKRVASMVLTMHTGDTLTDSLSRV